ncbi:hypothetical protein NC653_007123 [Populus alba x Populus x berolinensis]|uniref:Uncharacterized protein n=1 Tax=Populus alba x Populus x berolinensis TaxID=444605 RepID=A0AAD6RGP6_9ROSI|nr:hypothetical protein NC653_007123 [Populus alba x Populus x berolinensis]
MDLFSDWPDGVSGSLTVHLQNLHITIASVDFSADIDDVSFFEGLSAWMFHLLGFCLSGSDSAAICLVKGFGWLVELVYRFVVDEVCPGTVGCDASFPPSLCSAG